MRNKADAGIYTAEMGQPPQDIDGGSAPRKMAPKAAKPVAPKKPAKPKDESARHYKGMANSTKQK